MAFMFLPAMHAAGSFGALPQQTTEPPPDWPEGSAAYDHMVTMTEFGYRRIDTQANFDARNWVASELEAMGHDVERQPFTTQECSNCENIVVTIPGERRDEWVVVGAHHDAICYSPPPLVGVTYAGCTSSGAYDDGTGSGALLELARTMASWNRTPERTWVLGWWDYEEWQGSGSAEGGGMGSLHFVQTIPDDVKVTYLNLDMFGLSWPVPTPFASQVAGCDEAYWTLYLFTSPVEDWSYYEDRGLEVTDGMRENATVLQEDLVEINAELEHPEAWVRVIDDVKGNSDHFNFIMAGHAATWLRGQHQYIFEEGDACEQTPKHAQSDSVTTLNTMAGGRANVEAGLQTGLDILATYAWKDVNVNGSGEDDSSPDLVTLAFGDSSLPGLMFVPIVLLAVGFVGYTLNDRERFGLHPEVIGLTIVPLPPSDSGGGGTMVEDARARARILVVLYIAQGLPVGFVFVALAAFLAEAGQPPGAIATVILWATAPWSLKFLLGPLIDRFTFPAMGRRRPWILVAQMGMILTLVMLAFAPDPAANLTLLTMLVFVNNLFCALQDVSIDALAVDVLEPHEIERVNGWMHAGYMAGTIVGGAGIGVLIAATSFMTGALSMIPVLLLVMLAPLLVNERPGEVRYPWEASRWVPRGDGPRLRTARAILADIKTAFSLPTAQLALLLCLVNVLWRSIEPALPVLFIQELGWSQATFSLMNGGLVYGVSLIAYLVGGWLGTKYGPKPVFLVATVASLTCTMFIGLTSSFWGGGALVVVLWCLRTFAYDVALLCIFALVMRITWERVGGTQFTAYMAMLNLSAIIGYRMTEPLTGAFDAPTLFMIGAATQILTLPIALALDPSETRRVLGHAQIEDATSPAPQPS